jgi:hypothetical protein
MSYAKEEHMGENLLVGVVTARSALIDHWRTSYAFTTGEYGAHLLSITSQKASLISQFTHNAAGSTRENPTTNHALTLWLAGTDKC